MANWRGVFPAVTTQFKPDQSLDVASTIAQVERMVRAGVHGIIMLGSLGENCALDPEEKRQLFKAALEAVRGRVPVLSGVAECSTAFACRYASDMEKLGAAGLMVLPAMIYKSDPRETMAHFRAVAAATQLPIMVYNNPVAYGVDVTPQMFADLMDVKNLVAIKESSDNVRRLSDIINLCGDRYTLFCGVDDLILESMMLGAVGWVAGLVNAFPEETMRLYDLAAARKYTEALPLYRWFMPVLHLDVSIKLVQYIKLAQAMVGFGSETLRSPRLPLEGAEREAVMAAVRQAIETRPKLAA
ncbi:MAG: 1-pyrroline-4-hydroxy-2-carboxylate deaminase [Rhodospirillaceae bacterium]|jgi:dihydrodipicolinate synthase/N-acetylneuraminate lyase|nr:1-pyrroline-4-hydroxy-2-carboxylate deaminase [Rhodospirillaceae bacterium]